MGGNAADREALDHINHWRATIDDPQFHYRWPWFRFPRSHFGRQSSSRPYNHNVWVGIEGK